MKINYDCKLERDHIVICGDKRGDTLRISFQRTIRVSDSQEPGTTQLPPDFGPFPLFKTSDYAAKLLADVVSKSRAFLPIYQREALWINFQASEPFAIKIYVGAVNAVSGERYFEDPEVRARRFDLLVSGKSIQDYVVVPAQKWLDGIPVSPGEVRQFVAMPYGEGYSIEAQMTGEEVYGGMQFEVTPAIRTRDRSNRLTLTGKIVSVKTNASDRVIDLKWRINDIEEIPPDQQRLIFLGELLADRHYLSVYIIGWNSLVHLVLKSRGGGPGVPPRQMTIAAGGKIAQTIVRDDSEASNRREQAPITFNVQLLDAACFQSVTGQEPPPAPIDAATYFAHGFPFIKMYEEPSKIHGEFSSIKSVAQLKGQEEKHLDFPVKTIGNPGKPNKRAEHSFLNPKGAFMPSFRHITELEESVRALNLDPMRKVNNDGKEEREAKKVKRHA